MTTMMQVATLDAETDAHVDPIAPEVYLVLAKRLEAERAKFYAYRGVERSSNEVAASNRLDDAARALRNIYGALS